MKENLNKQIFPVSVIGILLTIWMTLSGCNHIELDYPSGGTAPVKVKVTFNWESDPDASPEGRHFNQGQRREHKSGCRSSPRPAQASRRENFPSARLSRERSSPSAQSKAGGSEEMLI